MATEKDDALSDLAYADGFQAGWNAAVTNPPAKAGGPRSAKPMGFFSWLRRQRLTTAEQAIIEWRNRQVRLLREEAASYTDVMKRQARIAVAEELANMTPREIDERFGGGERVARGLVK